MAFRFERIGDAVLRNKTDRLSKNFTKTRDAIAGGWTELGYHKPAYLGVIDFLRIDAQGRMVVETVLVDDYDGTRAPAISTWLRPVTVKSYSVCNLGVERK